MTARTAKAEATKARIRESAAWLYRERSMDELTLERIAERAGVTVQTVLRAFGSKDELMHAALTDLAQTGMPVKPTTPGDVPAAVAAVFEIYETIGDLVIRQLSDEERRPALRPILDLGREHHRESVRRAFAPQLAARDGDARAQLFSILLVATDVYVWKLLRRDCGLDRAAAEAAVITIITSVINEESSHGRHPLAELVGRR